MARIPGRAHPYRRLSVGRSELHAIGSLEDVRGAEGWRGRPEGLVDAVGVELMHVVLDLLQERRAVRRGQRRQVEGRGATACAASDNVDVLPSNERHAGGAAGA